MTSQSRSRSRNPPILRLDGGYTRTIEYKYSPPNVLNVTNVNFGSGTEVCNDYLTISGPRDPHPLLITKKTGLPTGVSGMYKYRSGTSYYTYDFQNYMVSNRDMSDFVLFWPSSLIPGQDTSQWSSQIINSLSQGRPVVDLPLFLFELKDFPRMLRDLGRFLQGGARLSDIPGSHVAFNFGWAPLLDDLAKLLRFQEEVENRIDSLLRLRNGRRIKRTLKREQYSVSRVRVPFSTIYDIWYERDVSSHVWFTARIDEMDEGARQAMLTLYRLARSGERDAVRSVLREFTGASISGRTATTIWNSIPWSWLIDYFLHVGDFLEAYSGNIPFRPTDVCVMHQVDCVARAAEVLPGTQVGTYPDTSFSCVLGQVGHFSYHAKYRQPYNSLRPTYRFTPFLTGRQSGILASLVLSRALKGVGL